MKLLNKLTIKNLRLNKKRSVMTCVGIALSVALIFTVITMALSLHQTLLNLIRKNEGNFHIVLSHAEKYEENIKNNKDVSEYLINDILGYSKFESRNSYKPYIKLIAASKEDLKREGLKLLEGKLPETSDEIVLSEHLLKSGGFTHSVGDLLKLEPGKRDIDEKSLPEDLKEYYKLTGEITGSYVEGEYLSPLPAGTEDLSENGGKTGPKTYRICGIVERPSYSLEKGYDPGYSVFTVASDGERTIDREIFYRLKKPADIERHLKAYGGEVNSDIYINRELVSLEGFNFGSGLNATLYGMVAVLIVVIMLSSIVIIRNSFAISIVEKTKQYGILKSIGATDKQVKNNIMYEGLILGITGSLSGLLVGAGASYVLSKITANYLKAALKGAEFKVYISIFAILLSLILGFLTILVSTYKIARRASKISPMEAIRSSYDIKVTKKELRAPAFIMKIFGIGGLISYKNLKRNRKKYRATILSIALSTAVFIGMSYFVDNLNDSAKATLGETNFNIASDSSADGENLIKDFESYKEMPSCLENDEKYSVMLGFSGKADEHSFTEEYINSSLSKGHSPCDINLTMLSEGSYNELLKMNRLSDDTEAVFVNKARFKDDNNKVHVLEIMKDLNLDFTIIGGGPEKSRLRLTPVEKLLPGMSGYNSEFTSTIYIREKKIEKPEAVMSSGLFIQSQDPDRSIKNLKNFMEENNIIGIDFMNIDIEKRTIEGILLLIKIFGYGFITVISLIGLTNVFNTISGNVYSRKSEFGTLMSLGMSRKQLTKMYSTESLMIALKGLAFGLPAGLLICLLVKMAVSYNVEAAWVFPVKAILISIAAASVLTFVIMKYAVSKVSSQNIIEAVRSENV